MPVQSRKKAIAKRLSKGQSTNGKNLSTLEDDPKAYKVFRKIGLKAGKEAANRAL